MRPRLLVRRLGPALAAAAIAASSLASQAAASPAIPVVAAAPAAGPCAPVTTEACPFRIKFKPHAYSAQVHSGLTMTSERWFVVHAQANQVMIVIVAGVGPTRGSVYDPLGRQNGQPGGRVFDHSLTLTGDYKIRVTEDSMTEAWAGRVDVIVLIY